MAVNSFRKQGGGTEAEMRAQSNVEASLKGLTNVAILDGTLLRNVQIGTTDTLVAHKLGRAIQGYIVCSNDTFATIKMNTSNNASLFISLTASAPCTVALWVF